MIRFHSMAGTVIRCEGCVRCDPGIPRLLPYDLAVDEAFEGRTWRLSYQDALREAYAEKDALQMAKLAKQIRRGPLPLSPLLGRGPSQELWRDRPSVPMPAVTKLERLDDLSPETARGEAREACSGPLREAITLSGRPAGKTFQKGAGSDPTWQRKWRKNNVGSDPTHTPSSRLASRIVDGIDVASIMTQPMTPDGD